MRLEYYEILNSRFALKHRYEVDAVTLIKPTSTTLYGLPGTWVVIVVREFLLQSHTHTHTHTLKINQHKGTAWNGLVHHRIALDPAMSNHGSNTKHVRKHLEMAIEAFNKCLLPTGRPHLSVCELGVARSLNMAGKILFDGNDEADEKTRILYEMDAKTAYTNLLNNWAQVNQNGTNSSTVKSFACQGAFSEAKSYTVDGPSYKQSKGLSTGAIFAISFGVIAGVAILGFSVYYVLMHRRNGGGDGVVDYNVMMDAEEI